MQVPAGVVYSAFGVTILIAAVLLLRAVTSLRRHFLNFHDGLEWPDGDPARRLSGSTETRLVLNGDPVDQVDDVPLPPPPPRVSLPEWVGGGGGEGAAKRVPPLSLVQLDKACPAAVLAQSTAGGGGDTEGGGEEGSTGEAPPCSVCLDDLEPGQLVRTLPLCGHLYHDVCITMWAARKNRCPVCNQAIVVIADPPAHTGPPDAVQQRRQRALSHDHRLATGRLYVGAPPPPVSQMMARAMSVGMNTRGP